MAQDIPFFYQSGHTTNGVFYYDPNHRVRFCSFDPEAVEGYQPDGLDRLQNFCSTSEGLLLCKHPEGNDNPIYRIVNPFVVGALRDIPNPAKEHLASTSSVIVVSRNTYLGRNMILGGRSYVFHVVCARPVPSTSGGDKYEFDIFSSRSNCWSSEVKDLLVHAKIRPESGISVKKSAFWLTQNSYSVVCYNLSDNKARVLKLLDEDSFRVRVQDCSFQLGVFGNQTDLALILIAVTDEGNATVFQWEEVRIDSGHGTWREKLGWTTLAPGGTVLRSQSRVFQLLSGRATRLGFLASSWPEVNPPSSWLFPLVGPRMAGERWLDCALPIVESSLHPVEDFPLSDNALKRENIGNEVGNPSEAAGRKRSRQQ